MKSRKIKKRSRRSRRNRKRLNSIRKIIHGGNNEKCIFLNLGAGNGSPSSHIVSGLGNQLFIYGSGIVAKNKTGMPLCMLPAALMPHSKKDYRYLFKSGSPVEYADVQARLDKAIKVHQGITMHQAWSPDTIPLNTGNDIMLVGGLYQNYSNVITAVPQIKKELFEEFVKAYGAGSKYNIISDSSAFMHVRRGDYIQHGRDLKKDYYERGISEISKNATIKSLYIVSNDIDWCKEQGFIFRENGIVFLDKADDELLTMYVMMLCKAGGILSGSTYSMWGAMLGPDDNQASTIVCPIHFGSGTAKELSIPNRWVEL